MKVILFGASGTVGQGALPQLLADPDVLAVLAVGRSASGLRHAKLKELVQQDVTDLAMLERELAGYDACLFCLGVSSVGLSEADYKRVTYDLTVKVAQTLERLNPNMTFVYVSGGGTDSTERAYMLRPGFMRPLHGSASKGRIYRALHALAGPVYPLLKRAFPNHVTSTEELGAAMLQLLKRGFSERVLENRDIVALASAQAVVPA